MSAAPEAVPRGARDIESERILAGIGLVLLATACFATLDTSTKLSTAAVPVLSAGTASTRSFPATALSTSVFPARSGRVGTVNLSVFAMATGQDTALCPAGATTATQDTDWPYASVTDMSPAANSASSSSRTRGLRGRLLPTDPTWSWNWASPGSITCGVEVLLDRRRSVVWSTIQFS